GVSLYHSTQWQEVLSRAYRMNLCAAILEDDAGVAAGCMLARTRNPFSPRFIGLPFSDYCPPLSARPEGKQSLLEALAAQLCARGEACELRGTGAPLPWKTIDIYVNWTLDLRESVKEILGAVSGNFRRAARRAREDGVTLSQGTDLDYTRRFYLQHIEN